MSLGQGDFGEAEPRPTSTDNSLTDGEQGNIFPTDVGAWLEDAIPDAEHVPFEESGHCPFWEEATAFNEAVRTFVEER
ncbi:alpha/beta fold hydrolase [Haloplanus halobius]|uniref:alpha/beta fold hydrolase n=1 Tax=Haloplanus halobius TaxID=2934938 RepID=UPI00200DC52B|nr:alpha/beta hydrolase [Haloplanus sp. XH21]